MTNPKKNRVDDAPSEKKVWKHVFICADPFAQNQFYSVQELLGAHVWDEKEGKTVFEDAVQPPATRVVLMKIDETGFAKNVNSGYTGNKIY